MAPRRRRTEDRELEPETETESYEPSAEWTREQRSFKQCLLRVVLPRALVCILLISTVYFFPPKKVEKVFAAQKEILESRFQDVPCSNQYKKAISKFKGCIPKLCGRLITDIIVSREEAGYLLHLAKKGLAYGGSGGGASILDLHSGALSQGNAFINIYKKMKSLGHKIFTEQDFKIYRNVRHKIQQMIAFNYGIVVDKLYLTHPTFFSEMTARQPKTKHDEYWHVHVDQDTYPAFHYTSLLYLTDYGHDFTGGRFMFVDQPLNISVEPRLGRVSIFTSGAENPHFVEKVESGTRYALTVSFTCDSKQQIKDPSIDDIS